MRNLEAGIVRVGIEFVQRKAMHVPLVVKGETGDPNHADLLLKRYEKTGGHGEKIGICGSQVNVGGDVPVAKLGILPNPTDSFPTCDRPRSLKVATPFVLAHNTRLWREPNTLFGTNRQFSKSTLNGETGSMRLMKQLSAVVTVVAVLALPFGMMGCAQEAPTSGGAGAADSSSGDADAGSGTATDTDLGDPEAGSSL